MPRAVPAELADRRRARLGELIAAIGDVRGYRVTQREFSEAISREQGTIAAILGGHRALGGDVLGAVLRAWMLPSDAFDTEDAPDFRSLIRASGLLAASRPAEPIPPRRMQSGLASGAGAASEPSRVDSTWPAAPVALREVLEVLKPDRPVAMALAWLAHRGATEDGDGWAGTVVAAQASHEAGQLQAWLARLLLKLPEDVPGVETNPGVAARMGPRTVVVHTAPGKSSRLSRA